MKNPRLAFVFTLAAVLGAGELRLHAQERVPPAAAKKPNVSVQVQVVVSRNQGEKKISSVPYTLAVVANGRPSQLRSGARVPVYNKADPTGTSFTYQDIGTNIDCSVQSTDEGAFEVSLAIDDNSIYVDDQTAQGAKPNEPPIFRQFRSNTGVILKDGQSTQFTAATDRVSGEVISIDVTLKVVK